MENFSEIRKTKIFKEISENDMQALAFCLKIKFRNYNKNDIIISPGQSCEDVVMILKGGVKVENIDAFGDISLISKFKAGDIYGVEKFYSDDKEYSDYLIATESSLVMLINKHRLISPCQNRCKRHEIVTRNLMKMIIERNAQLSTKLKLMSKKNTRAKVLAFLYNQSKLANSAYFDLPYNKTELANYLAVDRSALSTVLSKLRDEGIIDFEKKHFHINKNVEV